ncbi:MAG: hypothetical protein ACK5AZ_04935 [Bryobacteraceae bacterium]
MAASDPAKELVPASPAKISHHRSLAAPFYHQLWAKTLYGVPLWVPGLVTLILVSFPLNWLFAVDDQLPFANAYAFLGTFVVAFGLWALQRMYRLTLEVLDEVEHHLSDRNYQRTFQAFRLVYSNRYLLPAGLIFSAFVIAQWLHFGLALPGAAAPFIGGWVVAAGFVAGLGLWEAITSVPLVLAMVPEDEPCYFALAPSRSTFVDRVSQLFLKYSIVFAIEVLPFAIGFALLFRSTDELSAMGRMLPNLWMLHTSAILVTFVFAFVMPLYFIVPQYMIGRTVMKIKAKVAAGLQARINSLLTKSWDKMSPRELREFQIVKDVEAELHNSRDFPVSIFDMSKPLVSLLPSVLSLLTSEAIIKTLKQAGEQIFSRL